jgi:hypothetical protein
MPITAAPGLHAGPIAWERLHRETFLLEDRCWTTCGGGFCCSNNHPDFAFQLIPTQGTTLLYLGAEYAWLHKHGKVHHHLDPKQVPQTFSFDFGGPVPLEIVQTPCRLLGMCNGVVDKPLLCKVYPFLPVLDTEGRLEDLVPASIFEQTFLARGEPTPCTVWSKREQYLERWRKRQDALDALRYPLIVFYLQAAKIFSEIYLEKLKADQKLAPLSGRAFWQHWELRYLRGMLGDGPEMRRRLLDVYQKLERTYGPFLIGVEESLG